MNKIVRGGGVFAPLLLVGLPLAAIVFPCFRENFKEDKSLDL